MLGGTVSAQARPTEGYVAPNLKQPVFELPELELEDEVRLRLAEDLVQVAYFVSDRPLLSAKAIALANTLVPKHRGALVADFRFRMGAQPSDVKMLSVSEVAESLLQGAALFLDLHSGEAGAQPAACLLEIARALPVEDEPLKSAYEVLEEAAGRKADWSRAFPNLIQVSADRAVVRP